MSKPYTDPFLDPDYHIDTRPDPVEPNLGGPDDPMIGPDDLETPPEIVPPVEPPPTPEPPKGDEPDFIDYGDGMSATVRKEKGVWVATLEVGQGIQPQRFKGKTKDEMYRNLMKGQIEATKKIREQNKQLKLGNVRETDKSPIISPSAPSTKELSADDIFDLKTKLEANPDLAFETWFQKKFGMSANDLVRIAQDGQMAKVELEAEAEAKEFMTQHPDYFVCGENATNLYGWMSKTFLQKVLNEKNAAQLVQELKLRGVHTAENLAAAYEDLNRAGLLILKPDAAQHEPEEPPVAPTPQEPRIAKARGPRLPASYGLPANASAAARPEVKGVSDDDLDSLSDEELRKLRNEWLRAARAERNRR